MEINKEKLYEAFGEMIYAVAYADGTVQLEEIKALKDLLKDHPSAEDIIWSFNYEVSKKKSVQNAFDKAISVFEEFGPSKEYEFLLSALEIVANASDGIDKDEMKIIEKFKQEISKRIR